MRRWGKSIAALAVFASIFAYNLSHNKQAPSQTNSIAPKSSKQIVQDKAQQHPDTDIPTKKVELKQVIETQAIPFQTLSQNDPEITKGKTKKVVDGVAGVKKVTYRVTYVDGTETGRVKLFETVKKQPVAQVVKVGTQDLSETITIKVLPEQLRCAQMALYRMLAAILVPAPTTAAFLFGTTSTFLRQYTF
jgi:hypothetical protein